MSNHLTPSTPGKGQGPMIFMFGDQPVRIVMKDGEEWFVATDVAKALGFTHAPHMLRAIDKDSASVHIVDTSAGPRESVIISEPGLYQAIFVCRKPEAQAFRRWVAEVLSQIRKTGRYAMPQRAVLRPGPVRITRDKELQVLHLFLEGHTLADVGRMAGISRTSARNLVRGTHRFTLDAGTDQTTPELRAAVVQKVMADTQLQFAELVASQYCVSTTNQALAQEFDEQGRALIGSMSDALQLPVS
ncbi:BRO family protein [Limnohabitans sp.]|uniref:BRO-N domain-containing protein n=1 Tax=Limnohabitans sp. TaxID=1907725 RepID=UPI00286F31FF|nr:BRO family protein [Limnohabitans sp.]